MGERFVVVDLETTGNTAKKGDRIIQIGIVAIEGGRIVDRFSSFVNPECEIPPFIQQLTHIDDEMVQHAPLFSELAPAIAARLAQSYFVAHNVAFDWPFLQEEFERAGIFCPTPPMIDTVELSRILFPTMDSYKLGDLAEALHIAHEQPHQADSDAEVTAQLWLRLLDKLQTLPLETLKQLRRLSRDLKSDVRAIIDEIVNAKTAAPREERYMFYRGIALKQPEAAAPRSAETPPASFEQWAAAAPALPFRDYEYRRGQWEMMHLVHEAFETSQHALIEAGTGIGKSLAYLIPSVYIARAEQKPVVISTYTLQLGRQLIERDVPLLEAIVAFPFRAALLKGKRNYLSVEKFASFLREPNKNYEAALLKCQILVWLTETETGDVDELQLSSGGQLLWPSLHMDERKEAPLCDFFLRARTRANEADLVITNHSFLMQDLTSDVPLLPPHERLIVDEAHHLEDVASRYFGRSVDYVTVRLLLTRIGHGQDEGSLFQLKKRLSSLEAHVPFMQSLLHEIELECDEWFRMIRRYVLKKEANAKTPRVRYRFEPDKERGKSWAAIRELLWRLHDRASELARKAEELKERDASLSSLSFFADVNRLKEMFEVLRHLLESEEPMVVRWMEVDAKGAANATAIYSQPIELESFFAEQLFAKKKSVVLTSATLSVNGSFAYPIAQLGLEDFYPLCRTIPSPFDYARQAKVMVPTDMPSISDVSLEQYAAEVAARLLQMAARLKGKMLVLFTSHELLRLTASAVKETNGDETLVVLAQGVHGGSPAKLTRAFQQFERAMLFGAGSFWEGVDLPGDELPFVVIVRLPFAAPDDPVIEAKSDYIRARGGRPFYDLSLPQAVLRFKQGFGRLIRTKSDQGILFVFDRRLVTASYGSYFLSSLPNVPLCEAPFQQLLEQAEW